MPTFRSIRVALCNDYDIHGIPEFRDGLQDVKSSTFDVYAPIYCGSHLQVKYLILPPHAKSSHFLFKLLINGKHFVSWGTGPEDEYKGKVSFGLFDGGANDRGHSIIEKKALAFSQLQGNDVNDRQGLLEVKVHRANARRRVTKELERSELPTGGDGSLSLVDIRSYGYLKKPEKQRYYEYALLDPKDSPFVNFRYHFMTLEQLEALAGLADQDETPRNQSAGSSNEESTSRPSTATPSSPQSKADTESFIIARSGSKTRGTSSGTTDFCRRLSFPPRTRLQPTLSQDLLYEQLKQQEPRTILSGGISLPRSNIEKGDWNQFEAMTTIAEEPTTPTAPETHNSMGESSERDQKSRTLAAKGLKIIVAKAMRRKANIADEEPET